MGPYCRKAQIKKPNLQKEVKQGEQHGANFDGLRNIPAAALDI